MADEIAQVVAMEVEGVKLVFQASLEVAQFFARSLRALIKYGKTQKDAKTEKELRSPGRKNFGEIFKLSEGLPQVFDVSKEVYQDVLKIATEKGLHYAECVDFNPKDDLRPIMVPAQEMEIWKSIYKAKCAKAKKKDETIVKEYDKKLQEETEKLLSCRDGKEREQTETKVENLQQAKSEAEKRVEYWEVVANKEKMTMILQEYVRQSEGTDFEKSPEIAMAEYEKGVELGLKYEAKESLQPIRDKNNIPPSKYMFIVPENGSIITRDFRIDKDTGLAYSYYSLKAPDGELYRCCDKDMTTEEWNRTELPKLLDKAVVLEKTECRTFDTEEKLVAFLKYHGRVKSPALENVEKQLREGKPVFSSAEVKREILHAVSEHEKGIASASVKNKTLELVCDPNILSIRNGRVHMRLSEDETITFAKVTGEEIDEKGMARFSISDESDVKFVKKNNREKTEISISPQEALQKLKEMQGEGITKDHTDTITHNRPAGRR